MEFEEFRELLVWWWYQRVINKGKEKEKSKKKKEQPLPSQSFSTRALPKVSLLVTRIGRDDHKEPSATLDSRHVERREHLALWDESAIFALG